MKRLPLSNPFKELSKFELCLWIVSVAATIISFIFSGGSDYLTLTASLIGVTALIFVAKGYVSGQILTVIFAVFYGIISYFFKYYGEMITYLGMSAPIALSSAISWLKHPYKGTKEVTVSPLTPRRVILLFSFTAAITWIFYYILAALNTENLVFSTISVATSFLAASLTFLRSPYYALAYAANDIVLIVLWILAAIRDISYFPMIICFVMFLANDLYGFYNWRKMQKRQSDNS